MISEPCRAKINLYLRVLGRMPEGFHQLETLFQEIDLHDTLIWREQPTLEFSLEGAGAGPLTDNLVWRAIQGFAVASGCSPWGHFHLLKRIPVGGGLGGGSSDAAATLRLLQRLHHAPLGNAELARLALSLGSDVPFFLEGGFQLGLGRGEQLAAAKADVPARAGFLIVPSVALNTGEVFRAYAAGHRSVQPAQARLGENDLLAAATSISATFAAFFGRLSAVLEGEPWCMTGSGSTCVWLTDREQLPPELTALLEDAGARALRFRFTDARNIPVALELQGV